MSTPSSLVLFFRNNALLSGLAGLGIVIIGVAAALFLRSGGHDPHFSFTQNVSAQAPLSITFPEPMDHASVLKALVLPADIKGEAAWDGETLVVTHAEPLVVGASYDIVIGKEALRADGTALPQNFVFRFVVAGAPRVAARTPAPGAVDVAVHGKVTVVFDRPMVALTQVQGEASATQWKNWPVTIAPALRGDWRWISTYAAQFTPDGGLMPATRYSVSVPAGITTASGERTEKEASWTFETERPRIVSSDPADGYSLAGPTTEITLQFNQDVATDKVASNVKLLKTPSAGAGTPVGIKTLRFGKKKADGNSSSPSYIDDRTKVVVVPEKPLDLSSAYVLSVGSGTLGARGDLGTAKEFRLAFSTVGPLAVRSAGFRYGCIVVDFSSPLPDDTDDKNIAFSPPLKKGETVSVSIDSWGDARQATICPSALEPSTAYTLSFDKNFADIYGQTFAQSYGFPFTTPPVTPEVALAYSKGDFGIFERAKTPVYYINAVNVSAVTAEFAPLTIEEFMKIRQTKINSYQTVPNLSAREGYKTWSLPAKNVKNAWETTAFDVQKRVGAPLKPGIYVLLLRAPEYKNFNGDPAVLEQYFAVTDTSLTLKYSGDNALVWATDLATGEPVQGAAITLHALNGTTPVTGVTDAQGFFSSKISIADFRNQAYEWQPEFWVTSRKGDDFAFVSSQWNGGFNPGDFSLWSDFHSAEAPPFRLMHQMITDRPVYRPGDTVSFKGIVRLKDWNGALQLPTGPRTMQVTIQDPGGTEVFKKTLPFTPYGGFSDTFKTSDTSAIGSYTFLLQLLPESDAGGIVYSSTFQVLAYRKPEYRIDLTPEREDYFTGDTVNVDIAGSYYFGAPLSNAPVQWNVTLLDQYFNRYTDGWYSFSTEDAWCWWSCMEQMTSLTEGSGTLDASGHLRVAFPVSLDDKKVSQIATIEARVTDANNQEVSNRTSFPVHKSGVYVGVRNNEYGLAPGETAHIDVVTVDTAGKPVPNQTVTMKLSSRVWNSIRKKGVDGQYTYENEHEDTFIRSQKVTTGRDGKVTAAIVIPTGGQFMIEATALDGNGRAAVASTSVYAWSSSYVNWPHGNNDRIDVVADKPEYAVGDTAKLLVKSPFQGKGVKALVTVERENVITKKVIDVSGNALPIEIPITEDLVPNAFVSVVIVKPRIGETFDDEGKDTGVPAFRVGYARLRVETAKKTLAVTLETDKKQYLPGEKVTATITARDSAGKPVEGEFTMATVDMSVLALASFDMPDLVANFYSEHGLGVMTSQMLTYLIERFKPGSKGGGGDGADRKRGNFQDTAYWNPAVVTDKNGKATVSFTLPDNLTTWQLLALGSTKNGLFGGEKLEFLETKNVIVRPVRPRFAVRGDKITLGAIVHNFLPSTQTFTVSLDGSGFSVTGKRSQTVTLKPDENRKVEFPVVVGEVDGVTLTMRAETTGARDEIEETIPVYVFGTPQSVATTGQTESVVTETVLVPSAKDAATGVLSLTVSPSLATYLPTGLEYLLTYPYGCAEQTASTFLPQLALKRLQGFDAFSIVPDALLDGTVSVGLQRLYTFQRPDGGFGYWLESRESSAYLSAYILYALKTAQDSGYAVDATAISRAQTFLANVLRADAQSKDPISLATRAYILFVLSETGKPDGNLLSNLYEKRQDLPVFAQAELAMAMQKAGQKAKASDLLSRILDNAFIDPRGAHVEERQESRYRVLMQTNTRTTAETLQAMIRIDPDNALVPQFIRFLLAARKDGHWDTTQSTTQSILALVEYLKSTGELDGDFIAGIEVNGKMIETEHFSKKNILTRKEVSLALNELARGQEATVKIGIGEPAAGVPVKGTLFYDMLLSYFYTGDVIEPVDQGMSILRELTTVDAKDPQSLTSVKVGDTYRVTLTMTVPEDRYHVAVESPHPAGLEGIDLALQTSRQTDVPPEIRDQQTSRFFWWDDEEDNGLWRFSHKEFRDDRVFLFADYLPAGVYTYTYMVRATTPGTFRQRPARMFEMYFPENFGQTGGGWFTVKE